MTLPGRELIHWLRHFAGLDPARTQVSLAEREQLGEAARNARCIVELGVFEGATAAMLRKTMHPEGMLTCIDPFPKGRLGISFQYAVARREVDRAGGAGVRFLRTTSDEAAPGWSAPIDLLFIDADHSYPAVRRDWEEWTPWVRIDGIVALHDSRVHPGGRAVETTGPVRLVREIEAMAGPFVKIDEVDSLTLWRRRS